jgi:hypothetical protein
MGSTIRQPVQKQQMGQQSEQEHPAKPGNTLAVLQHGNLTNTWSNSATE